MMKPKKSLILDAARNHSEMSTLHESTNTKCDMFENAQLNSKYLVNQFFGLRNGLQKRKLYHMKKSISKDENVKEACKL